MATAEMEEGVTGGSTARRSYSSVLSTHPDFGGGSSGSSDGAVPDATVPATPPSSLSHGGAADLSRKSKSLPTLPTPEIIRKRRTRTVEMCDSSTQTRGSLVTFSPKTCYELLKGKKLNSEQTMREFTYLKARGCSGLSDLRTDIRNPPARMFEELENVLNLQIHCDYDESILLLESVTSSVSYLADKAVLAAQFVEAFESARESVGESPVTLKSEGRNGNDTTFFSPGSDQIPCDIDPDTATVVPEEEDVDPVTGNFTLPNSVCKLLDTKITEIHTSEILAALNFENTMQGGRKTLYFGSHPYSYGRITHEAKPYPNTPIFTSIFNKLQAELGPEFNSDNYSCLVTLYENGSVCIPRHSDNEQEILADSKIYTVSIGATRTLQFVNNTGKIRETNITLENASVYSMDAASQSRWSHSVIPDHSVTEPRISFTFRRLRGTSGLPNPIAPPVPPIKAPEPVKPRIDCGSHRRILFLTDSVLGETPDYIFNKIGGGDNYRCIKKMNYELKNIFNFEPEFGYSDIVIISCGVNDLARYGRRSEVLADLVINRLRSCCKRNRNTNFVFTALLSTSHGWLNRAIGSFNRYMFELAAELPNLAFFDSHQVLMSNPISRGTSKTPVLRPNADGVHITFDARKLVTTQLINGLNIIAAGREGRQVSNRLHGWNWPLRPAYLALVDSNWRKYGSAIAKSKG